MVYYGGLLLYISALYLLFGQMKRKDRATAPFFSLACLGVILFQGFRAFTVGTDLASYLPGYLAIGKSGFSQLDYQNYEVGYVVLNKILYRLGLDTRGFLIAVAAIVQIPIFYTMGRYSKKPLLSILWYFAFGNFLMTFSGLRQSIAMSLCFAAYYFIRERKLIFFCLAILFASLFHFSALFCLLLYPVYFVKLDKRKFLAAVGIMAVVFIFRGPLFSFLSRFYYGEAVAATSTGAYTMFIAYALLFLLSFHKKDEDEDYIGLRNILLLLPVVYSFAPMHDYVARIGYPLSLYMTVFVPKLVKSYDVTPKGVYYGGCYLLLTICFFYFLGGLDTLPFRFGVG